MNQPRPKRATIDALEIQISNLHNEKACLRLRVQDLEERLAQLQGIEAAITLLAGNVMNLQTELLAIKALISEKLEEK